MVCDTFSDVFPSTHADARQSFAHLQLARGIMREHRAVFGVGGEAGFDEQRFVITDAFIAEHQMTGTWQAFNGTWQPFFWRKVTALGSDGTVLQSGCMTILGK